VSTDQWSSSDEAAEYGRSLLTDGTVTLRELREDDLELLTGWWNSTEWAMLQQRVVKPRPVTAIADTFRGRSENKPLAGTGFSIVATDSGELLGHLTLYGETLADRAASFAIMIGGPHVGRGVGPRATRLALSYGFRELGLNRIELHVWAFNTRAIRAYEKAGFVLEGRRREVVFHNGCFHDELIMSVLASEYFAPAGSAPAPAED
jgi:RimJ/RimL family protein N-acetyltransferase